MWRVGRGLVVGTRRAFYTVPTEVNNIVFTTGDHVKGQVVVEELGMVVGTHSSTRNGFSDFWSRVR